MGPSVKIKWLASTSVKSWSGEREAVELGSKGSHVEELETEEETLGASTGEPTAATPNFPSAKESESNDTISVISESDAFASTRQDYLSAIEEAQL